MIVRNGAYSLSIEGGRVMVVAELTQDGAAMDVPWLWLPQLAWVMDGTLTEAEWRKPVGYRPDSERAGHGEILEGYLRVTRKLVTIHPFPGLRSWCYSIEDPRQCQALQDYIVDTVQSHCQAHKKEPPPLPKRSGVPQVVVPESSASVSSLILPAGRRG